MATLFRTARPILNNASRAQFQSAFARNTTRAGRRFQGTSSDAQGAAKASWFKTAWDSPIGVKTVHFWAPVMKWALVLAGVSDFARPAESLSLTQNAALTATGAIWTRWCLIIKPKNILLATVNFFLGCVGAIQVTRILMYQNSPEGKAAAAAEKAKKEETPEPVVASA
ncbi:hypothetical protein V498_01989 [Pseudogymnoascus sp. VKM F-4517 (FW-2822)]|nr:hypothetical protein V498_01989 [Pseudogymnoascus sp. VKM F-4517 (FW-2822)]